MAETVKIKKGEKVLEVTEKAYEVVYKDHGFELVDKSKSKRTEKKGGKDES